MTMEHNDAGTGKDIASLLQEAGIKVMVRVEGRAGWIYPLLSSTGKGQQLSV